MNNFSAIIVKGFSYLLLIGHQYNQFKNVKRVWSKQIKDCKEFFLQSVIHFHSEKSVLYVFLNR